MLRPHIISPERLVLTLMFLQNWHAKGKEQKRNARETKHFKGDPSFVLKLRHATSVAIAEVTNIATQSQLMARQPCAFRLICLPTMAASRFAPEAAHQQSMRQTT